MSLYFRVLDLSLPQGQSAFLWGPRKVGKSTFLKDRFPDSAYFDLLDSRLFLEFSREPWRFTEYVQALPEPKKHLPIIVDEVQKVPAIMDEIHRLIETHKSSFILCGSSARKMKRGKANLLGGRAWRFQMAPLTSQEIPEIDLLRALQRGLVPSHYETSHFRRAIGSYVTDYLREEVFAEGLIRNIGAFSRFFRCTRIQPRESSEFQQHFSRLRRRPEDRARIFPDSGRHLAGQLSGTLRQTSQSCHPHKHTKVLPV